MNSNSNRAVRQSAQEIFRETDSTAAREAIWDYLPFSRMQCLQTIENLLPEKYHQDLGSNPEYVAISNEENLLLCYWNDGDSQAYVATYALSTGKKVFSKSLDNSHTLALGNNGKIGISNDYYPHIFKLDTQEFCLFNQEISTQSNLPNSSVTICPSEPPLAAFWDHIGPRTEIELWDYEHGEQRFRYVNTETYQSAKNFGVDSKSKELCFSPDGSLLIAKFYFKDEYIHQNAACCLKVWETHSAELVYEKTFNLQPMSGCSQHHQEGFLLYGITDKQVTIQTLLNDKVLFQQPGNAPCHMTLDGRIIAFCTGNSDVEVWDWRQKQKLTTLRNQTAPLLHLEVSQDREFVTTHSRDGSIKIWGIPENIDDTTPSPIA